MTFIVHKQIYFKNKYDLCRQLCSKSERAVFYVWNSARIFAHSRKIIKKQEIYFCLVLVYDDNF